MPNRILKNSICSSEEIDQLSWFEEVFFYRLIVNADDYGRFDGRTKIIKASLFPLKDVTEKQIINALQKLEQVGLIVCYEASKKPILQLVTWANHQQIRNKKTKYPLAENGELKSIEINCTQKKTNDCPIQYNTIQSNTNPIQIYIPTLNEVREYCIQRGNGVDPEEFYDYYQAQKWTYGEPPKPVIDWKARVRYWEKHAFNTTKNKKKMPDYFQKLNNLPKEKPTPEEIANVERMAKNYKKENR